MMITRSPDCRLQTYATSLVKGASLGSVSLPGLPRRSLLVRRYEGATPVAGSWPLDIRGTSVKKDCRLPKIQLAERCGTFNAEDTASFILNQTKKFLVFW